MSPYIPVVDKKDIIRITAANSEKLVRPNNMKVNKNSIRKTRQ
jgi:hypothetical protein